MQIDVVRTNKAYKCRRCTNEIEKRTACIIRLGSKIGKEKRIYFSSRYHMGCFGQELLDRYDEKRKPKKGGPGRPTILSHLTKAQRKRRHRVSTYLNTRDKQNLLKFYEEENISRTFDTWYLIAERIEELLTFEVVFKLPWQDTKLALLMVQNDTRLTLSLADQKLEDFPRIIWDYVRTGREALRDE